MISQTVKARMSWWSGALVLILTAGTYLDSQQRAPEARISLSFLPSWAESTKSGDQLPQVANSGVVSVNPLKPDTPLPASDITLLDVEAARQTLYRKENAIYEKATQVFEAEPVDITWASAQESALRTMFTDHAGLMAVSVNTVHCRASMCRVEVFTAREPDAEYFTAMFYNALDNFRDGALQADTAVMRKMEQGVTAAYVARQGYVLHLQ